MAGSTQKMEFQFVNSTVSSPTVPQDVAVRALIRKQAMKKASAARRRDGNYGKHNLRQYPVFIYDQATCGTDLISGAQVKPVGHNGQALRSTDGVNNVKDKDTRSSQTKSQRHTVEMQRLLVKVALNESLSSGMSAKGYELTSMKTDFDILDLSTLATLHVGRATRAALSQNPEHLIHQLRSNYDPQWSYLAHLPSRYDQINCLSDAANCVIARARHLVSPNQNWEAAVISFYVKALYSLQRALDDHKLRFRPEVLCATEILAMYELLDPTGETAWIRHTAGAARLIQLRGPKSYVSEFEKALFMAHTVPIMTECLLNGERCFLEQKAWQRVFASSIKTTATITDRSEITVTMLMLKCQIPGKFADVTSIVCGNRYGQVPDIIDVSNRLRQLRADLIKWHGRYQLLLRQTPKILPGSAEYDSHCKVFATYLSCLIISSRLLSALSSYERLDLEEMVQGLVEQMFKLEIEVRDVSMPTSLFMAQTLGVAQATKATTEDWCEGLEVKREGSENSDVSTGYMIEKWKFEKWNNFCGRQLYPTPSGTR